MIIVSQDKKRTTESMELFINMTIGDNEPAVYGIYADKSNSYLNLGIYQTEERAKEVLQKIIKQYERATSKLGKEYLSLDKYDFVYEMPEN